MNTKKISVLTGIFALLIGPLIQGVNASESIDAALLKQLEQSRTIKQEQAKQVVWENMYFTENEEKAFWPLYADYKNEIVQLNDQLLEIIKNYAVYYNSSDMHKENGLASFTNALDIESARIEVKRKYIKKFKKIIPEKKVARFFHIDNKIEILVKYGLSREIPLMKAR